MLFTCSKLMLANIEWTHFEEGTEFDTALESLVTHIRHDVTGEGPPVTDAGATSSGEEDDAEEVYRMSGPAIKIIGIQHVKMTELRLFI